MEHEQVMAIIANHNGTISGGINWTWATFASDTDGRACFAELRRLWPTMEHSGYYPANPSSPNPNLHRGGFRFR